MRRSLVFVLRPSHGRRRGGLEERHPPAIPSWLIRKSELQCGGPSSFPDHDFASKKKQQLHGPATTVRVPYGTFRVKQ